MAESVRLASSGGANGTDGVNGVNGSGGVVGAASKSILRGRAFYESLGSPKYILAPMVDQSEFAWRMLSRSYLPPDQQKSLLAYSPMLHARLFAETEKYRRSHFQASRPRVPTAIEQNNKNKKDSEEEDGKKKEASEDEQPWLDGNATLDRPLFVQFCANDPSFLLEAAKQVAPYCDAVDLNLGCPQGIAKKGHYGAFLQEDQELIYKLIRTLHENLSVPVTAKMRVLETKEETLAYAKNILAAGASILTVHGRRREQKGHITGLADWTFIRYLRDNLPPETVIFANGNVLQHNDLQECLDATGADGVMSAEGNLSDPAIFTPPPTPDEENREYWRGVDGKGGWRLDGMMRRYLDIIYTHALDQTPPPRRPLFLPGDDESWLAEPPDPKSEDEGPAKKKRKTTDNKKKRDQGVSNPNIVAMQPHLFHLLRHLVSRHTDIRDMLGRSRKGDLEAYEEVLLAIEKRIARALLEYREKGESSLEHEENSSKDESVVLPEGESSVAAVRRCRRVWWVAQPIVRPLPLEALAKGSIQLSKKDRKVEGEGV